MEKNKVIEEKSKLVKKIEELKGMIKSDELREINKLYDRNISVSFADLLRLRSYRNFLQSYVRAKYQNTRRYKENRE